MNLDECYKKGLIKRALISSNKIKSLIEMSDATEKTISEAKLNRTSISSYVALSYESLRELLEAICISKGFKVVSHICLGELMKTLLDDFDFYEFDRLRYIRNGVNYYGTKIELQQGTEIIRKTFAMRNSLKIYLEEFL